MSGHSKWATTKHKKAAIDAKRGKLSETPDIEPTKNPKFKNLKDLSAGGRGQKAYLIDV